MSPKALRKKQAALHGRMQELATLKGRAQQTLEQIVAEQNFVQGQIVLLDELLKKPEAKNG